MTTWIHLEIVPALLWLLALAAGALLWQRRSSEVEADGVGWGHGLWVAVAMLLFMFSAVSDSIWFYFLEWEPQEKGFAVLTESIAGRICLLTALLTPLLVWKPRVSSWMIMGMALYFPFRCSYSFLKACGGQFLTGDDHPAFLFRLFTYEQIAPLNVFYNPYWNGGRVDSALAASGANMVGNMVFPFLKLFPVHEMYNGMIVGLFIFLIPLVCGLSVRIVGGSWRAASVGILLGLLPSRLVSKWVLHFGTLGANLALPFMILAGACLFAMIYQSRRDRHLVLLLIISSVIFLSWPVGVVMGVPLLIAILPGLYRLDASGWKQLGLAGVLISILAWPQFHTLLFDANLSGFSQVGDAAINWEKEGLQGLKKLLGVVTESNPLLLFAGGVGVWLLPNKSLRWMWGTMLVLLLVLAGWGELWKPQFQLTRAVVPLAYVALVPAALIVDRWMNTPALRYRIVSAGCLAMLMYTGINASRVYANDRLTAAQFRLAPEYMEELTSLLQGSGGDDGRVMFTGATVHRFGGGHVAYLPVLTGREMMACDYYHFSPKMVEYNYPPKEFRHREGGVEEFIDLYNVTHVVAHRNQWHRWLRERPELFEFVAVLDESRPIEIYRVKQDSNWFIRGAGTIDANADRLMITLNDPTSEAVIKYNYDSRLQVSGNAELVPHEAAGVELIAIRPGGDAEITIRFK